MAASLSDCRDRKHRSSEIFDDAVAQILHQPQHPVHAVATLRQRRPTNGRRPAPATLKRSAAGGRITPSSSISANFDDDSATNATGVRSRMLHQHAIRPQTGDGRILHPIHGAQRRPAIAQGHQVDAAPRIVREYGFDLPPRRVRGARHLKGRAYLASRPRRSTRIVDRESGTVPGGATRYSPAANTTVSAATIARACRKPYAELARFAGRAASFLAMVNGAFISPSASSRIFSPACETLPAPSVTIASPASAASSDRFDPALHRSGVLRAAMAERADSLHQRLRGHAFDRGFRRRVNIHHVHRIRLMKCAREFVHQRRRSGCSDAAETGREPALNRHARAAASVARISVG